ncbi:MAG: AMP-binding protein, partial [Hydrogenimonas sp.]|nr:AMP-binding protein [Hydrogenimonas sp.]
IDIFSGYGMSETCPVLTIAHVPDEDLSEDEQVEIRCKTGRPIPLVDLRVVDEELEEVPRDGDSVGEIVVRAPWLTQGYLKDQRNSEVLWRGSYLHTGDVAHRNKQNYVKITDRIKDVIKIGGEWISSLEIEDLICALPGVAEAAVIGLPDDKWGEKPLALVVKKVDADLNEKGLLQHRSDAAMYRYIRGALKMGSDTNATYEALWPEGYAMIGNFQQLWLDSFKNFNSAKNYGVIRDGYAVGIVVEKDLRPLLILAGDPECTFAVYIGEVRAPGIATGMDERHMVVKYIPQWLKLKKGDTVLTSGLDKIFPPGIPVGRVVSTQKMQGFQNAYIELYGDTLHPDLVWVVSPDKTSTESDS